MGNQVLEKNFQWFLALGLIVLAGMMFFGVGNDSMPPADNSQLLANQETLSAQIASLGSNPNGSVDDSESRSDEANDEILRESDEERIVRDMALDYIDTRDFKKELVKFLNGEGEDVESYRDIDSIVVKEDDYSVSGQDGEAELAFKVYYFNDGDDDDDDRVSASVLIVIEVEDIDEDEDYEDTDVVDVDDSDFDLLKFHSKNR